MVKTISFIGFLSLAVAFNANAHDSDRIIQLEKEVQQLKVRTSKLESLLSNSSESKELAPSNEGWKSLSNWRRLTTEMIASDVQEILGEPQRVDGGKLASWYYENGGIVTFYKGKVDRWMEPRK